MSLSNGAGGTPYTPTSVTDLDSLLSHVYPRYVLPVDDFQLRDQVCAGVIWDLHEKMTQVDSYYRVQSAGSPDDNVRISKPDEFEVTIELGLPVSFELDPTHPENSDIVISPVHMHFVKLRIGTEVHLSFTDESRVVRNWMDKKRYLLRSEFTNWFKTVVKLALNTFEKDTNHQTVYQRNGICYTIRTQEVGPAMTLIIENDDTNFKLKVRLLPALKVPESRFPPRHNKRRGKAYEGGWLLVAESVETKTTHDQTRAWKVARPDQEKAILQDAGNPALIQAWRLVKKLRDSLDLQLISNCHIKNVLLHEIVQMPKIKKIKSKRQQTLRVCETRNIAFFFEHLVRKLFIALLERRIDDFWIRRHNLLGHIDDATLLESASRLWPFLKLLESPDEYRKVAGYLLTPEELQRYNDTVLYTD